MYLSKKHLFFSLFGLTLLFSNAGLAQETSELAEMEAFILMLTIEDDGSWSLQYPTCPKDKDFAGMIEQRINQPKCEADNYDFMNTANTAAYQLCRGAVGGFFGGGTGKLLTSIFGGESLMRLLEIASVSEISGHTGGLFICENVFGEGQALDTESIDWLLEPNSIAQITPATIMDTTIKYASYAPTIAYEAVSTAVRGTFVFLIVKTSFGVGNPALAFILGVPLRSLFGIVKSQAESLFYETPENDDETIKL